MKILVLLSVIFFVQSFYCKASKEYYILYKTEKDGVVLTLRSNAGYEDWTMFAFSPQNTSLKDALIIMYRYNQSRFDLDPDCVLYPDDTCIEYYTFTTTDTTFNFTYIPYPIFTTPTHHHANNAPHLIKKESILNVIVDNAFLHPHLFISKVVLNSSVTVHNMEYMHIPSWRRGTKCHIAGVSRYSSLNLPFYIFEMVLYIVSMIVCILLRNHEPLNSKGMLPVIACLSQLIILMKDLDIVFMDIEYVLHYNCYYTIFFYYMGNNLCNIILPIETLRYLLLITNRSIILKHKLKSTHNSTIISSLTKDKLYYKRCISFFFNSKFNIVFCIFVITLFNTIQVAILIYFDYSCSNAQYYLAYSQILFQIKFWTVSFGLVIYDLILFACSCKRKYTNCLSYLKCCKKHYYDNDPLWYKIDIYIFCPFIIFFSIASLLVFNVFPISLHNIPSKNNRIMFIIINTINTYFVYFYQVCLLLTKVLFSLLVTISVMLRNCLFKKNMENELQDILNDVQLKVMLLLT